MDKVKQMTEIQDNNKTRKLTFKTAFNAIYQIGFIIFICIGLLSAFILLVISIYHLLKVFEL